MKATNPTTLPEGLRRLVSESADKNAPKVLDAVSEFYDYPQRILVAGIAESLEQIIRAVVERLLHENALKAA